ncbi:MAG: BatD family protein [bacterium]
MRNPRTHRLAIFTVIIALIGWLLPVTASSEDLVFTTSVDRADLSLTETLTLMLQIESTGVSLPEPKFPNLADFRIISGPNESSVFQVINTRVTKSKTYSFVLKPEKTGFLTIGAAEVTYKKKLYRTKPIRINVSSATAAPPLPKKQAPTTPVPQVQGDAPDVFIKVFSDKKRLYQNEQVVLTYKLYTRVSVTSYEISKMPANSGFWSEEFQLPQQPVVEDEVIGGRHYRTAVIRRLALFPTHAGDLVVDPLEVTCQIQVEERQQRLDPFGSLFDNPFSRYRTMERILQTEPLTIPVQPAPLQGKPANFSGAVGDFSLEIMLDKRMVKANEALTMTVRFGGTGNIQMLPEPAFKTPAGFEFYEPKETVDLSRTGSRITGSKIFEYVLIPRFAGKHKIPPVTFAYFDPETKTYRTLTEGGFEVEVATGAFSTTTSQSGRSKEEVKLLEQDIRYLKSFGYLAPLGSERRISFAYWAGMALPLFVAILLWGGNRILGGAALQTKRRMRKAFFRANRELKLLEKSKDGSAAFFFAGIQKTLLEYISTRLNLETTGLLEETVLEQLTKANVPDPLIGEIRDILHACNYARFASEDSGLPAKNQIVAQARTILEKLESNLGSRA